MSTTMHDSILFILFVCHFKCSSSLQQDEFWLAINVFIIHHLKKIVLKVISVILFLFAVIFNAVMFFFENQNDVLL